MLMNEFYDIPVVLMDLLLDLPTKSFSLINYTEGSSTCRDDDNNNNTTNNKLRF